MSASETAPGPAEWRKWAQSGLQDTRCVPLSAVPASLSSAALVSDVVALVAPHRVEPGARRSGRGEVTDPAPLLGWSVHDSGGGLEPFWRVACRVGGPTPGLRGLSESEIRPAVGAVALVAECG
jgi:hypothetical protein